MYSVTLTNGLVLYQSDDREKARAVGRLYQRLYSWDKKCVRMRRVRA